MGNCCSEAAVPVYDDAPEPVSFQTVMHDNPNNDFVATEKQKIAAKRRAAARARHMSQSTGDPSATPPPANAAPGSSTPVPSQLEGGDGGAIDYDAWSMYSPTESEAGDYGACLMMPTYDPRGDIDRNDVGNFVDSIRRDQFDPSMLLSGARGMNNSIRLDSSPSKRNGSFGGDTPVNEGEGLKLNDAQQAMLDAAIDPQDRLMRLQDIEASQRLELFNAMMVTTRMIELAAKRVVPTIRSRPSTMPGSTPASRRPAGHSRQASAHNRYMDPLQLEEPEQQGGGAQQRRPSRPVLVIHHKDVDVDDSDFNGNDPLPVPRAIDNDSVSSRTQSASPPLANGGKQSSEEALLKPGVDNQKSELSNYSFPTEGDSVGQRTNGTVSPSAAPMPEPQGVTEQLEILELTAMDIPKGFDTKCTYVDNNKEGWDFLSLPNAQQHLNAGHGYFSFKCVASHKAEPWDIDVIRMWNNVTCFRNEEAENNVPIVDIDDRDEQKKYTACIVKAMYLLPGVKLSNVSAELLATTEYQKNCQPGNPKIFDDVTEPMTFRSQKVAVKFVYSIVVQMRCSEITDPAVLQTFKSFDGIVPSKILVMERTKRNKANKDSTAKCKSFLIYYPVTGGQLLCHITVILNTAIPRPVASIVSTFAKSGKVEAADTCKMTTKYFQEKFGDCRDEMR